MRDRTGSISMPKKKDVDESLIRALAALLHETGLTEIEIEQSDSKIRVARQITAASFSVPAAVAGSAPAGERGPAETAAHAAAGAAVDPATHPGVVKSPMVGTAYRSPEPGARPYADVGEPVGEGQTVMIVEAMKTMNQIAAPRGGKITAILVDDGQPVEYGEPLVIIE